MMLLAEEAHESLSLWQDYWQVVTDPAHIFAEFTFILVVDVLLAGLLWPLIKHAIRRHDEKAHGEVRF